MEKDLKILLTIADRPIAEEIQLLLEKSGVHSLLTSDNPASSVMQIIGGATLGSSENLTLQVHADDYKQAVEIVNQSPYWDLFI